MIALVTSLNLFSQIDPSLYGDEWINDDQSYFKFEIGKEGIYRISKAALEAAGIPVAEIAVDQFQLFTLGQEVALRITSEDRLSDDDYIEFYATANDGSVDALLFDDAERDQLNPFISLYSQDKPYYLTWSSQDDGIRYTEIANGMTANSLPPKEPYYIHREIITYDEFHHKPSHDGRNFIRYSSMDESEGYGSELAGSRTIEIPVDRLSSFGVDPRIVMRMGTNVISRNWSLSNEIRELQVIPQQGYGVVDIDRRFPLSELREGNYQIHIDPISAENQKHTIAQIELHYPRRYEFDGEVMLSFIQQASIISRYIELKGFGGSQPILYNITDQTYVTPEQDGSTIEFVTSAASKEHTWMLVDMETGVQQIENLRAVPLKPKAEVGAYLIISHEELINSGAIDAYADYRSSDLGGNYETSIIDIDDLVERYAYGIEGHPIAIKNFMKFLQDQEDLPDYTFLIGKGREYTEIKEEQETQALVPTFGIPGSDNLYMAFDGYRHPVKPIGRLAARTADDVMNYLDKIKTHEIRQNEEQTQEFQAWKKGVIHLSGGSASNQSALFRFLNDMGGVISNNTFGADVKTFRKTSADPLERATTEAIMTQIDKGAALLTFFGHSAVGTFDFSLEDPSQYSNEGRNPIILSLGCHSGNIHTRAGGISEDFVLEKNKGAIAFIASSGTAYPEPQYFTGINLYDLIGGDMYGLPIGDILQRSLEERTNNPSVSVQTLIEQLTLHGDPAYRFGSFEGPDYSVDQSSVTVEPAILNATTPTFTLTFDVINLGASRDEVLDVEVIHVLPDGSAIDTQIITLPAPRFNSTITIELDNPGEGWIGSNRLLINVDPQASIAEYPNEKAEQNNELIDANGELGTAFFVFDNSAKPILPESFGIHSEDKIILRSAVNNGLDPGGTFIIQIDTSETFESPFKKEIVLENETSIIEWSPDIAVLEGVVYYWRIAPIKENDQLKASRWQSSSFIHLSGHAPGWNQSHFYQWKYDNYYKLILDETSRNMSYDNREWDVRIKNEIRDEGDFWVYVNNTPWASLNPRGLNSMVSIFAWDQKDVIFKNSGSDFGSIPFTSDGFIYDMNAPEDADNIVKLLDAIPDGARVFFHTMLENDTTSLNIPFWSKPTSSGPSVMDQLELQGATRVRDLIERGTVPYTFVYDKGVGAVVEDIANNIYETVDLSSKVKTIWGDGSITSIPIKAKGRWLRLMWSEQKEANDDTRLLVLGIKPGGKKDTLKFVTDDYDVNLTSINPQEYPEIELVYQTVDPTDKTSAQLDYWRVITNELPDAAFYSQTGQFEIVDTLNAGENLYLDFDLVNLTDVGLEELLIKYTFIGEDFKEKVILQRSDRLDGLDTIRVSETVSTDLLSGSYQVVIEVNPNQEQKELSACNNLGFTKIYVRPDLRNPFLDVTFNGRHIANGERIDPNTQITVSLLDEGAAILLNNPNDFDIKLYYPELLEWKAKPSVDGVTWKPAETLDDNKAIFELQPDLNQEGIYVLEVQAKDIAGNKAGNQTYRISFEIDSSTNIEPLVVSPNPMTSITEFSYYLESDLIPDDFELRIFTTHGKLIKTARKEDFGGLRKGVNSFLWDGRSDYGSEAPQGLYYYEIFNNLVSRKDKPRGSILKI